MYLAHNISCKTSPATLMIQLYIAHNPITVSCSAYTAIPIAPPFSIWEFHPVQSQRVWLLTTDTKEAICSTNVKGVKKE